MKKSRFVKSIGDLLVNPDRCFYIIVDIKMKNCVPLYYILLNKHGNLLKCYIGSYMDQEDDHFRKFQTLI